MITYVLTVYRTLLITLTVDDSIYNCYPHVSELVRDIFLLKIHYTIFEFDNKSQSAINHTMKLFYRI